MVKRKYPYIFQRYKLEQPQGFICSVCGAPAVYRCEVQVNWFRGDDVAEKRCEAHSKLYEEENQHG